MLTNCLHTAQAFNDMKAGDCIRCVVNLRE